jgi:pimeloyl-ACP methyl ester carboxylesterase
MSAAWTVTSSDGVEIAVHDLGGSGPTLILGHATGYCASVWEPVAASLRAHFRCIAPDCRAHGASGRPAPDGFSWPTLGTDVLAVVDALALSGPLFGAGHSAGATGVALAEVQRPGTFDGLWCFEPVLFPPRAVDEDDDEDETSNPMAAAARGRRARFADRQDAARHYEGRKPFSRFAPPALTAFLSCGLVDDESGDGLRLACRPEDEARFYEMGGFDETWLAVESLGCPVTFATGDQPGAFGPGHAELLAGRIPYGQPEVLPGLSHFGPLESPDLVARSIVESLGGETTGL